MIPSAIVEMNTDTGGRDFSGKYAKQRKHHAERDHQHHHQRQQHDAGHVGASRGERDGDVAAGHHHVALREIDRARRVQDQHEAEREQRVGAAERERVEQRLEHAIETSPIGALMRASSE